MSSTSQLYIRYYASRTGFVDGTTEFHALVRQYCPIDAKILELGSGPSNPTSDFLATLGSVDGLDINQDVLNNRALRGRYVFEGDRFPFDQSTYDCCVSNYVLEHVADPLTHFAEVARVMKPQGAYIFRTPNLWHYVSIAARLLPFRLHEHWSPKLRVSDVATYPTFYRANSAHQLHRVCRKLDLHLRMEVVEREPSYGRISWLVFYPMMLYERAVNRFPRLECLRANIFGVATRAALNTASSAVQDRTNGA